MSPKNYPNRSEIGMPSECPAFIALGNGNGNGNDADGGAADPHPHDADLLEFMAWWTCCGNGAAPMRHQFEMSDHTPLRQKMMIIDAVDDADFRPRLIGSALVPLLTEGQVGGTGDTPYLSSNAQRLMIERCKRLRATPVLHIEYGTLGCLDKPDQGFEALWAPFLNDTGTVAVIVVLAAVATDL